jgi:hypothetical protein
MKNTLLAAAVVAAMSFSAHAATVTPPTNPLKLDFNYDCKGGGTRVVTGTWDTSTGALNVSVAVNSCIGPEGATHNGTDTISGTLQAGSTAGDYSENLTEVIATNVSFSDGGSLTRNCTITRNGSYTGKTDTFTGTTSRNNCTVSGSYHDHLHVLDDLLKRAVSAEDQ